MPLDIKDLYAGRTRRLTVDLGGTEGGEPLALTVTWSPERYTKQVHAAVQDARETRDAFAIAESVIVPLLTWWDLTADGAPYPITAETVAALGLFIELKLMAAIEADMEVEAGLKGTSGARSSDGAGSASPSPTGTPA